MSAIPTSTSYRKSTMH